MKNKVHLRLISLAVVMLYSGCASHLAKWFPAPEKDHAVVRIQTDSGGRYHKVVNIYLRTSANEFSEQTIHKQNFKGQQFAILNPGTYVVETKCPGEPNVYWPVELVAAETLAILRQNNGTDCSSSHLYTSKNAFGDYELKLLREDLEQEINRFIEARRIDAEVKEKKRSLARQKQREQEQLAENKKIERLRGNPQIGDKTLTGIITEVKKPLVLIQYFPFFEKLKGRQFEWVSINTLMPYIYSEGLYSRDW